MKKILSLALAVLMLLSLCACWGQKAEEKQSFRVGFGSKDITPVNSVPLSGYGNSLTRMSDGTYASLLASCLALQDENGNTALLISTDAVTTSASMADSAKETISKEYDIPMEQIMISATHTHSSPDYGADHPNVAAAKQLYIDGVVAAARKAMEDLSPATIQIGTTNPDGLNFVRHYEMNDGTYSGDNHGSAESGYKDYATEADTEMQIIRYVREEEGKKDIITVNWQAHPKLSSSGTTIHGRDHRNLLSSDFVGTAREYVEAETNCHFIYYQGASGNMNPVSSIPGDTKEEDCRKYGKLLSDAIIAGLDGLKESTGGTVAVKKYTFSAPVDHSDDGLVEPAKKISEYWAQSNDYNGSIEMGKEHGIYSPYHADAILIRSRNQGDLSIDVYAVSAGGISFVAFPYEMFDTNGKFIKENTPFDMTFIMGYANSHLGYIASSAAYDYGCYEVDIRRYEKGTGEKLADQFVTMLKELKG